MKNATIQAKIMFAVGLLGILFSLTTLHLPAQSPTPVATLTEDQKWDAFYTLRGQGTWADYGVMVAPGDNPQKIAIDSTIAMYPTSSQKDRMRAQDVAQPMFNLMAPNFWAQFKTK